MSLKHRLHPCLSFIAKHCWLSSWYSAYYDPHMRPVYSWRYCYLWCGSEVTELWRFSFASSDSNPVLPWWWSLYFRSGSSTACFEHCLFGWVSVYGLLCCFVVLYLARLMIGLSSGSPWLATTLIPAWCSFSTWIWQNSNLNSYKVQNSNSNLN